MKYSREKADSILCNISTTNEYKFTDTCFLIIDYLPEEIKHFRNINCNPESLYDGAKSTYAPIPYFVFSQKLDFIGNYESKADIYVLGWGRGKIIDKELLRSDRAGLPER